jgi:hypothetical protein
MAMEEKPTAILQAEEVTDLPGTEQTAMPSDTWSKFPPQIDDPSQSEESKAPKGLMIVVVVLILLALGVVGFVVYKSNAMSKAQITDTPIPTPEVSVVETPEATPTPAITDKSVVKIQVLNGSGIVGQAGQVATALEKDDFKTPDTGNYDGDKQSETMVNYTASVDKTLVDEVVKVLKKTFTTVNVAVSTSLSDFDIQVITGTDK